MDKVHTEKDDMIPKKPKFDSIVMKEMLEEYVPFLNEAQVIAELEKKGIGRPSTFASFVSKIESRKYVEINDISQESTQELKTISFNCATKKMFTEKKKHLQYESQKIILSALGEKVAKYLYENYQDFFDYHVTKEMESSLDNIANGSDTKTNILRNFYHKLEKVI